MGNIISNHYDNVNCINALEFNQNINNNNYIIINTLNVNEQFCLIKNTVLANDEENLINNYLTNNKSINIIIYGKNSYDKTIIKKYSQLLKLGFKNLNIYMGGLFEWGLLQEIYGENEFQTTSKIIDVLYYK